MAGYAFRSLPERQNIQRCWEDGLSAKGIAIGLGLSLSTVYNELRRGWDGVSRLPDQRRAYSADLAQLNFQKSLERRGRKAAEM